MYSKLFSVGLLALCAFVAATPIPVAEPAGRHLHARGGDLPAAFKEVAVDGGDLPGQTKKRHAEIEVAGGDLPGQIRRDDSTAQGGDIPWPGKRDTVVEAMAY